ncbi:acetyl-CoA carboxylase biotin carboxyl carrier protein subunit, partial [bacterium]
YVPGDGRGSDGGLTAPMPGRIIAILASKGAKVEKGAPLLILEAMKMENTLAAPCSGTVADFRCEVGDQVKDGMELIDFVAD